MFVLILAILTSLQMYRNKTSELQLLDNILLSSKSAQMWITATLTHLLIYFYLLTYLLILFT